MTTALARQEMQRFLTNSNPEVLSISGRWGIGKTYGWNQALEQARNDRTVCMERYAYVSAFGVRSLDDLKTAVFQSTVNLSSETIEPTFQSFQKNIRSLSGAKNLAEQGLRKGAKLAGKAVSAIPYIDKAADLVMPGLSLLIKNQMICIDDIERAGSGLDITDILGFVSMLREEKSCKVVLLLNEQGLEKEKADTFRKYLEKVVDQAIQYSPSAAESAFAALDLDDPLDKELANHTVCLGITNIRVIKRIHRFLGYLMPQLEQFHGGVKSQAIKSTALFGWSVFEPAVAPNLEYVKKLNSYAMIMRHDEPTNEEARWNLLLKSLGFNGADDFDLAILAGLEAGGFDEDAIKVEAEKLHVQYAKAGVREGIQQPWNLFGDSFDDNVNDFKAALIASVEQFAQDMGASDINGVVSTLKDLGEAGEATRLLALYMEAQANRSREFFNLSSHRIMGPIDDDVITAFEGRLASTPLALDPKEILTKIGREQGWSPKDTEFLASVSEDEYYDILKSTREEDLRWMVRAGLDFKNFRDNNPIHEAIGQKMIAALRRIANESPLNAMRVRPYIGNDGAETSL